MKTSHFRDDKSEPGAGLEKKMGMKVLVKNRDTGLFLKGETLWTNKPDEARDFGHCSDAINGSHNTGLTNAELVLTFGHPSMDINISLSDTRMLQPATG
jgi:hypothetical protein